MNITETTKEQSLNHWRNRIRASVHMPSNDDVEAIAVRCQEAQEKGENCSVWHNAAAHYGTRCNCAQCHTWPSR
jgi:hypothetical protein